MKQTMMRRAIVFWMAMLLAAGSSLAAQDAEAPQRYFDAAPAAHAGVRLVSLYPSNGSIRALEALKKEGLIDFTGLTVIGVYHVREKTKYAGMEKYAVANKLDWLKFHGVSADFTPQELFQKNACSPEFEQIFKKSDGMIFFGGPDIPPQIYGEKTSLLTEISDPYRHYFETSFIFHLLGGFQDPSFKGLLESRPNYAILGLCLGGQSLNVGAGGALTQDIWSEIYGKTTFEDIIALGADQWHNNPWDSLRPDLKIYGIRMHPIVLKADGKFCREMGFKAADRPYIFSAHHQQVKKPGKGFRLIATSPDGKIAEAFDHEKFPNVLAVQFHPEASSLWSDEASSRMSPDEAPVSLKSILDKNPPSLAFHKKIWSWFESKVRESAKKH